MMIVRAPRLQLLTKARDVIAWHAIVRDLGLDERGELCDHARVALRCRDSVTRSSDRCARVSGQQSSKC
jgi:hypothetical protein